VNDRFYFRQLLSGRDFAVGNDLATSMRNFTYVLGDRETGEALLVDPAYRPAELVTMLAEDGLRVAGVIATHFHPDHIGGALGAAGHVDGVAELLEIVEVPIHVQRDEVSWVTQMTGVPGEALVAHDDRDRLRLGELDITLLHTPGHTPGSQCLLVEGKLLSGDTLFIDGCGRTDFPGGDAREMFTSLSVRLAHVSDDTELYPGHLYSPESRLTMREVRDRNFVLAPVGEEQWLATFGP
jgi:hydroxyacylglutathione hydrolase